jgi:iron-sulfur cluster repair protein YtfE (RIC family)
MSHDSSRRRGLSVNAAFLKDIKDDSRDLKHLMDRILPLAKHPQTASNHWRELSGLFADLRDQLALHFALEEAYGYFDDALISAPRLSVMAEALRGQHSRLFERIRGLADKSCEVSADSPEKVARLLNDFQHFREELEHHEEEELKLILDALENDLGVGD